MLRLKRGSSFRRESGEPVLTEEGGMHDKLFRRSPELFKTDASEGRMRGDWGRQLGEDRRPHPFVPGVVAVGNVGDRSGGIQGLGVSDHRPGGQGVGQAIRVRYIDEVNQVASSVQS